MARSVRWKLLILLLGALLSSRSSFAQPAYIYWTDSEENITTRMTGCSR